MPEHRTDIALIGYACRLPGAPDASAFWSLLEAGRCAVTEVPADRFPRDRYYHPDRSVPGKSYTFKAGILDDVFGFDPGFFGISPREAIQMDPQQRLLLQVVHEAVEQAGMRPSRLAGSSTGVFVGASSWDYSTRFTADPAAVDVQMMTGNTLSIIANRISYIFDLRGPSFTVDTACSSSLVALHEAVEAIRSGRIDTAIVGGVNVLGSVGPFIGFARASMLSPSGLCRAFDAAGDGYVRAEGAVAIVLKSAAKARADRDRIHALVVGSGINADGRTVGLSLPSSEAQGALLEEVYARADFDRDALAFVEAHGTGTRVGDPAEAGALGRVLGARRSRPLPIGSVKTNIGHLEPASGLAGVLKSVMALQQGVLPASLHFHTPNPDIPFDRLNLAVAATAIAIPRGTQPRYAGVNSFGFGGANAHVILKEGDLPAPDLRAVDEREVRAPLIVSAQSREALERLVRATRDRLAAAGAPEVGAIVSAAAHSRDRYSHRLLCRPQGRDAMVAALDAWLAGERPAEVVDGRATTRAGAIAFVFSGNGSQWAGMGQAVYATNAVFRRSFEKIDRLFMSRAGWSLLTTMFSADLGQQIERTEVAQPLLFAVQVALVEALAAVGIAPDAVVGHSVGEVAAAWAAGALDLGDAVTVIHARSTHQEMTRHLGGMAALSMSAEAAEAAIAEAGFAGIEVAARNSPRGVTISGPSASLDEFLKFARSKRWALKRLDLAYPFHCALVDPIRAPLAEALAAVRPHAMQIPFVSTVTGKVAAGTALDAEYWWDNVRQPVMFQVGIEEIARLGSDVFIEIGPRAVLTTYVSDTLKDLQRSGAVLGSLDKSDTDQDDPVLRVAAAIVAAGGRVEDEKLFGREQRPAAMLPTYAWNNQSYCLDRDDEADSTFLATQHPLIGVPDREGSSIFHQHIDTATLPWLGDHQVGGSVVLPAAALAEMALAAGRAALGAAALELKDFDIIRAMVIDHGEIREVSVRIGPDASEVAVLSRLRLSGDEWSLHARGFLSKSPTAGEPAIGAAVEPVRRLDAAALYGLTEEFGLGYGPAFRRAIGVDVVSDRVAEVHLAPVAAEAAGRDYLLHPTLLDAAFHGLFALLPAPDVGDRKGRPAYLPTRFGSLRVYSAGAAIARCRIEIVRLTARSVEARFVFAGPDGEVVARLEGARFSAVKLAQRASLDDFVYRTVAVGLASADASPVAAAWPDGPAAVVADLGLVVPTEGRDPSEGRLLVDAAVTFAAVAAVAELVGKDRDGFAISRLIADGRLGDAARPLFARLLAVLAADGFAEEADGIWRLTDTDAVQPVDLMVRTILADHPEFIAEATLISRLAAELPRRLAAADDAPLGSEATREHFASASPTLEPLAKALTGLVRDLAAKASGQDPIRLLVAGAAGERLIAALVAATAGTSIVITVTDADASMLERCRLAFDARHGLAFRPWTSLGDDRAQRFDLIVGADVASAWTDQRAALGVLAACLAPGGALILAEPEPAPLIDLTRGAAPDWWRTTGDPDRAEGRLPLAGRWKDLLAQTTLLGVEVAPLADPGALGLLVTARARPAAAAASVHAPEFAGTPAVIVGDGSGQGRALAAALAAQLAHDHRPVRLLLDHGNDEPQPLPSGILVSLVPLDGAPASDRLIAAALPEGEIEVIFTHGALASEAEPAAAALARTAALASLVRALGSRPARLWVIAPGACQTLPGAPSAGEALALDRPSQAAVWGFARVVANEYPQLDVRLVDPAPALEPGEMAGRLAGLIAHPGDEREIMLSGDGTAALRIVAGGLLDESRTAGTSGPLTARLEIETQGSLDRLRWDRVARQAPGPGEVEIAIAATGLNFRDVMWAMGLLPAEALEDGFAGPTLGMECSGVIVGLGEGVSGFELGEPCVAFAAAAFAGHVTVPAHAVAPLPARVPLEAAATIPVAFLTAWYALVHLARIEAGETLLVHGGAGGVGLAALQIAKTQGVRVIATAGSEEKRALLTMLGADHVLDSRSLGFADAVMRLTGGAGVDVVLNSLAGEAMERSLGCLRPFGRFLELGKRDFYGNTRIGLRPFRQNLSYFGIDADQLLTRQLKLAQRLFRDLIARFEDGSLTPLPYRAFAAGEATQAFRLMQQAGHIGKIVIRAPEPVAARADTATPFSVKPDARYLIVGGTGGFGLALALRLARNGARHLVLASRRGRVEPGNAETLAAIEALGANVEVVALDATVGSEVAALVERLGRAPIPLKGVFLTAMVLDDGLIAGLDPARIDRVLQPKIAAAAHLDRATRGLDLDCFVLYSSATTLIGNPGQANYVAANAYLEALARRRRLEGLPGLAIAWGAISDAGYLARNHDVGEVLSRRLGRSSLTAEDALDGLAALMAHDGRDPALASIAFARIDWAQARRELALVATPLFAGLSDRLDTPADMGAGAGVLGEELGQLEPSAALDRVAQLIAVEIERILRIPAQEIDRRRPLSEIGMDSLMALELRMAAEERLGVDIPLMSLAGGASLDDIAARALARLTGGAAAETGLSAEAAAVAQSHLGADAGSDALATLEETSKTAEAAKRVFR